MGALVEQQREAQAIEAGLSQGGQLAQGVDAMAGGEEEMAKAAPYAEGVRSSV